MQSSFCIFQCSQTTIKFHNGFDILLYRDSGYSPLFHYTTASTLFILLSFTAQKVYRICVYARSFLELLLIFQSQFLECFGFKRAKRWTLSFGVFIISLWTKRGENSYRSDQREHRGRRQKKGSRLRGRMNGPMSHQEHRKETNNNGDNCYFWRLKCARGVGGG